LPISIAWSSDSKRTCESCPFTGIRNTPSSSTMRARSSAWRSKRPLRAKIVSPIGGA
jgi:hypothetical protein